MSVDTYIPRWMIKNQMILQFCKDHGIRLTENTKLGPYDKQVVAVLNTLFEMNEKASTGNIYNVTFEDNKFEGVLLTTQQVNGLNNLQINGLIISK